MAKAKTFNVSVIEKARRALEKAATKEPDTKTVSDALEELKPTIEAALAKGYSRVEIAELLTGQGMDVKEYQIKTLFKKQRPATE